MSDKSYEEIVEIADEQVRAGAAAYFKWTCKHCGNRCTFQEPNVIYKNGECCVCGEVTTDIEGYGVMIAISTERKLPSVASD